MKCLMNHNEDPLAEKKKIIGLIQNIKKESQELRDVMWSREEISGNKEIVNTMNLKINHLLDQIIKNLYWYQKVEWKRFLPNREQMEQNERQEQIKKESARFLCWVEGPENINEKYFLFHKQLKERELIDILSEHGYKFPQKLSLLEVGCRDGSWLKSLLDWGALPEKLVGIDLKLKGIDQVKNLSNSGIQFVESFPDKLPFEDEKFDVVLMFGFLMHILDDSLRKNIGQELLRVLSNDGIIVTANLSKEKAAKLDHSLLFTSLGLDFEDITTIFPHCLIDFKRMEQFNLAVIRRKKSKKEDEDRNGE